MNYLGNATNFLSQAILGFALYVVLLRFWMQWVRADFRNPIGQFVVSVTNPVVIPLRKILPSIGAIDTATVVLAMLVAACKIYVFFGLRGGAPDLISLASISIGEAILYSIHIFIAAIFIKIIASWINPHGFHPIVSLAHSIAEPIMAPARRIIPPIGGLDLSPILVLLFLNLTIMLVVHPLKGF